MPGNTRRVEGKLSEIAADSRPKSLAAGAGMKICRPDVARKRRNDLI